jgi:hypothetical protein
MLINLTANQRQDIRASSPAQWELAIEVVSRSLSPEDKGEWSEG